MVPDHETNRSKSELNPQDVASPLQADAGGIAEPEKTLTEVHDEADASAVAEGPRECGEAATAEGMGLSVTPHALKPKPIQHPSSPSSWRPLLSGFDTLDLGFYVLWNDDWDRHAEQFRKGKVEASGTKGLLFGEDQFLIWPSGKSGGYSWHLEGPDFHFYLSYYQAPHGDTPNVYVSPNAKFLWTTPLSDVIRSVERMIHQFGGRVLKVKPSRCDFTADFLIPGGLSLEFIEDHQVPSDGKNSQHKNGNKLETFYFGAKKSPIQLRIYDKGLEVQNEDGKKLWFRDIWKLESCDDVWRFEFQVRRAVLKQLGIDTVSDLQAKAGGAWEYLTGRWFSLRMRDSHKASRRTVLPLWESVRECARRFGPAMELRRDLSNHVAPASWYVGRGAGCLPGYAARRRLADFEAALTFYMNDIRIHWEQRGDFDQQYIVQSIKLGLPGDSATKKTEGREAA